MPQPKARREAMLQGVYDEIGAMPETVQYLHARLLRPKHVTDGTIAMRYKRACDQLSQAIWSLEDLVLDLEKYDEPVVATLVQEEMPDGTPVPPPVAG